MLEAQVIELAVGRCALTHNVLEDHCNRDRNQVLHRVRRCDRQVPQTEELCLLSVEIDERADTVRVRIEHEVHMIVVVDVTAVPLNAGLAYDWLLFKDHGFIL